MLYASLHLDTLRSFHGIQFGHHRSPTISFAYRGDELARWPVDCVADSHVHVNCSFMHSSLYGKIIDRVVTTGVVPNPLAPTVHKPYTTMYAVFTRSY